MTAPELTGSPGLSVLLDPADLRAQLSDDVRKGLTAPEKWLPPKYFYDDLGSELFEEITRVTEYYPTRAERTLLHLHATEIAALSGASVLLELGSGSSAKTRILLDALSGAGRLSGYVAVDVSQGALAGAVAMLAAEHPGLPVEAVVADFERDLCALPVPGSRLVAFLGGTIGNFAPRQREGFLSSLSAALWPGESLLVGLDLVKDPLRLVAAYDDAAGVTARFNKNVLRVLNRELGADFDIAAFTHVARWDPYQEWIEMRLQADRAMTVDIADLGLEISFRRGEEIRTEISAKFRRAGIERELAAAGLSPQGWWSDGDYALVLAKA
ncbi:MULTISPECIES: L-histidine N(alpha)-methyltransferase [unclassified Nocardioides]|uniref:L-histidine N(alpha)-methyltransferase n=1 Tax=unclassified Nocardioides TaxID=2615069 RepID=UPI0009F0E1C6|nr:MULTISPECIES: L-histidine N(alpha)-methyltransferase [unclassified Nocardioides]GAW49223.1 methyltransferase [Nocardioides sp. PD653-B2]GAW55711.1 methyltransferase [Nocardioides sp. PD653]